MVLVPCTDTSAHAHTRAGTHPHARILSRSLCARIDAPTPSTRTRTHVCTKACHLLRTHTSAGHAEVVSALLAARVNVQVRAGPECVRWSMCARCIHASVHPCIRLPARLTARPPVHQSVCPVCACIRSQTVPTRANIFLDTCIDTCTSLCILQRHTHISAHMFIHMFTHSCPMSMARQR